MKSNNSYWKRRFRTAVRIKGVHRAKNECRRKHGGMTDGALKSDIQISQKNETEKKGGARGEVRF